MKLHSNLVIFIRMVISVTLIISFFLCRLVKELWSEVSKLFSSKSSVHIDLTMCDTFCYFLIVNITQQIENVFICIIFFQNNVH